MRTRILNTVDEVDFFLSQGARTRFAVSKRARHYWRDRHKVPGAFDDIDFLVFDHLLAGHDAGPELNLLEIGAFLGKSAILMGIHTDVRASLIVCDVFEDEGADDSNTAENAGSYQGLTRQTFEANYREYVQRPPVIVQELSSGIRAHVPDGTIRFAHVDGGHLHEVVREDVTNVRHLLAPEGVVAFDDYRAFHTPGVAAAVWSAVANDGLIPIVLTESKFYGTWVPETARIVHGRLDRWIAALPQIQSGSQRIAGVDVTLIANPRLWTPRRSVKAALPPLVAEKLLRRPVPYLGG